MIFKEQYEEIKALAEDIYKHPELGYKEVRTKRMVQDFITSHNPAAEFEEFAITGFKTTLGQGKPMNLAFIAELDAVYAPTHMHAAKETGAAHNCGHYTQVGIALALYRHLLESNDYENYDFSVTFVFIPAEEYLDLPYRDKLIAEGKISHYGGKPEAMKLGAFDEFDFALCVHAMGGVFPKRTIEINCDLAGFLYKRYTFNGKPSHAGFDPFSGTNAYHISTLFNTAIGLGRQQLNDAEMVRINPIVMESDMSTNVVPSRIKVGTDLRSKTTGYMKQVAERLDAAAKGSAMALQGTVDIETQMGYLPFVQDRYLSTFVKEAFEQDDAIEAISENNAISAAGDIGDLSFMMPCIQIGYSGFTGTIHGDDFIDTDPEYIYEIFPRFLARVLATMNGKIERDKLYKRSYQEYVAELNQIVD
ncbi:M20/M25/M40 family metallo-hydrolase [Aureibacillus halotolerans]|uniref:Amidohydrolase n=1 Tax=Aureibacillus halotolerans TaxID=1508390 RepID=A0A4R6TU31_9BACI|nr:M20/M25/M40 family metallo-hydrolase [Aureibacillus halotolerans]TDQ33439.1 amidohydrolase [Aureibacillus halotolerans]